MRRTNNRKAFTLPELAIVIAVIGILAAILIPTFSGVIEDSHNKSALSDAANSITAYVSKLKRQAADSVVVFVRKSSTYYVYGYVKAEGKLEPSINNTYDQYSDNEDIDVVVDQMLTNPEINGNGKDFLVTMRDDGTWPDVTSLVPDCPVTVRVFEGYLLNGGVAPVDEPEYYNVTYSDGVEGEELSVPSVASVRAGSTYSTAAAIDRSGYVFKGWRRSDTDTLVGEISAFIMPYYNITLTAEWNMYYTVSFTSGVPGTTLPEPFSAAENTNILEEINARTATAPGYSFLGWSDGVNNYTAGYTYNYIMPSNNVVLTALWLENQYTVLFETGTTDPVSNMPVSPAYYHSGILVVLTNASNGLPTRSGYRFKAWKCNADNYSYAANGSYVMPARDVTFTAEWSYLYTVTYNLNGGSGSFTDSNTYVEGALVSILAGTPTNLGYLFVGWSDGVNTLLPSAQFVMPAQNVTLTAQWEFVTYTVTFTVNPALEANCTGIPTAISNVSPGTNVTMPAGPTYTRTGDLSAANRDRTFSKWTYNGRSYDAGTNTFLMPTSDVEFVATFTSYWVVSYFDGTANSVITMPSSESAHSTLGNYTVSSTVPTYAGFDFTGWLCSLNSTIYQSGDVIDSSLITRDFSLTAQWHSQTAPVLTCVFRFYDYMNDETTLIDTYETTVTSQTVFNESNIPVPVIAAADYVKSSDTLNSYHTYWKFYVFPLLDSTGAVIGDNPQEWTAIPDAENSTEYINVYLEKMCDVPVSGVDTPHSVISTQEGFYSIDQGGGYGLGSGANYVLASDIPLSINEGFTPIGWSEDIIYDFQGKFDGLGYTISDYIAVDSAAEGSHTANYYGLFASNTGTIQNIVLEVIRLEGNTTVGGIAGSNEGNLYNCHVLATTNPTYVSQAQIGAIDNAGIVGGIAGVNVDTGIIRYCSSQVRMIYGFNYVGGLVGQNYGIIQECFSTSGVNSDYRAYIMGTDPNGNMSAYYCGGLVGGNTGNIYVSYVKPAHDICGTQRVGGLLGDNAATNAVVQSCYVVPNSRVYGISEYSDSIGRNLGSADHVKNNYLITSLATGVVNGMTCMTADAFRSITSATAVTTLGWTTQIADFWNFGATTDYPILLGIKWVPQSTL